VSFRLPLGDVELTLAVEKAVPHDVLIAVLRRHATGDWGDIEPEDIAANNASVHDGTRVLSRYATPEGRAFWVLTEADRSRTTVLFPEEY